MWMNVVIVICSVKWSNGSMVKLTYSISNRMSHQGIDNMIPVQDIQKIQNSIYW
jgi:hypothetical protein